MKDFVVPLYYFNRKKRGPAVVIHLQAGLIHLQAGDIDGTTRNLREGMSITRNVLPAIQTEYPAIQTWDEIHIESITAIMKYHNGTDWITMIVGQEYDEVTTDELTLDATNLLSQGTYILHLTEDAITNRKINKFRTDITINS